MAWLMEEERLVDLFKQVLQEVREVRKELRDCRNELSVFRQELAVRFHQIENRLDGLVEEKIRTTVALGEINQILIGIAETNKDLSLNDLERRVRVLEGIVLKDS